MDIFEHLDYMFVSPCSKISAQEIKELINLCSGKLTDNRRLAKYFINEKCKTNPNAISVNHLWILDSITNNKLKKVNKYLIKENDENFA